MKLIHISCDESHITLKSSSNENLNTIVRIFSPSVREKVVISEIKTEFKDGEAHLPRNIEGRDGLYLGYSIGADSAVHYVDDFDMPARDFEYPVVDTKKGLQIVSSMIEDAVSIGVKHAAYNVCIGDLMRSENHRDECIEFCHDGKTFWFDKKTVESIDRSVSLMTENGILVTLICLCSLNWSRATDSDMTEHLIHPDYVDDRKNGGGLLSAFNVMTDDGIAHYAAFIAFLTERYTAEGFPHGRAVGLIISNEVNSHWIWGNAGLKTVDEYAVEYTTALRIACQASADVYKNMRVYISLDHFWTGAQDPNIRDKYTGSRYIMEAVNRLAKEQGDFYWNVAFHPYPENLNFPDFWNDKTATDDNDTYRVTFKNLGVLRDFLYREENLYNGIRRRIILSEQGFNSHWTVESEILQACAYGHAYRKVMEIPEIDSFILHAHCDNAGEFGLNLGIWRRNKEAPGLDAPKPIYYVFKAIDKRDETGKWHWERY